MSEEQQKCQRTWEKKIRCLGWKTGVKTLSHPPPGERQDRPAPPRRCPGTTGGASPAPVTPMATAASLRGLLPQTKLWLG